MPTWLAVLGIFAVACGAYIYGMVMGMQYQIDIDRYLKRNNYRKCSCGNSWVHDGSLDHTIHAQPPYVCQPKAEYIWDEA